SSRRRHTRFSRDWSSDVCSSDLSRTTAAALKKSRLWDRDGRLRDCDSGGTCQTMRSCNLRSDRYRRICSGLASSQSATWLRSRSFTFPAIYRASNSPSIFSTLSGIPLYSLGCPCNKKDDRRGPIPSTLVIKIKIEWQKGQIITE